AGNENVVAKRQAALCFAVVVRHLHPEETRIEIARLRVIGYLHGNVVDVSGVGWGSRLRGAHRGRCRRRERQGPNELTAGHLSVFVVLKQLADDVLHLIILLLPGFPFCPAEWVRCYTDGRRLGPRLLGATIVSFPIMAP